MSEEIAMKILFASVDAPPKVGGVSLLADSLSEELAERFCERAIFLGPPGTFFDRRSTSFDVYVDHQAAPRLREGRAGLIEDERIFDLVSKLIKTHDIDHVVLWHPFYYGPGATRAAQASGIPISIYIHGTELTSQIPLLSDHFDEFAPQPKSQELPHRLYRTMVGADRLFVNSQFTGNLVKKLLPDAQVTATGCGISSKRFETELGLTPEFDTLKKSVRRERLGLPNRKTISMVGRLVPHKNQSTAIELINHLKEAQLVIIGSGPNEDSLREKVSDLGLQDRVFFAGAVDEELKWQYLRASELGLLISDYSPQTGGYEGFGIVSLEYAAAGCIPVSNGNFGMSDFSVNYGAGLRILHDGKDLRQYADDLEKTLDDEVLLQSKLEFARNVIDERYTWTHVADLMGQTLGSISC